MHKYDEQSIEEITRNHVGALEPECRWCFAIDLVRVKASITAQYSFEDSEVLNLSCPRCGGEFSYYIRMWSQPYLEERITKLHPELKGQITDDLIREVNYRMWPEFDCDC